MRKLLKWDFLNLIKTYSWLYISYAAVLAITAVFPDHFGTFSGLVNGLSTIYSLFFYGYTLILSVAVPISWLRKNSARLELSLPVQPGKILLSKLILSISINISGLFLTKLLWLMIKRFGMSHIVLFNDFSGFFEYTTGVMMLIMTVTFSYIAAKSFRFTRNKARSATVLISLSIGALLVGLLIIFFCITLNLHVQITDAWNINAQNNSNILTPKEGLKWLVTTCAIVGPLAVIIAGFFGSSALLRRKFERY